MDRTGSSGRPLIGVIVFVHPKQDVNVPLFGLENDASVILVYANRPQVVVLCALDFLVIVRGGGRVGCKFIEEAAHLLLLFLRKTAECREEVSTKSQFDIE